MIFVICTVFIALWKNHKFTITWKDADFQICLSMSNEIANGNNLILSSCEIINISFLGSKQSMPDKQITETNKMSKYKIVIFFSSDITIAMRLIKSKIQSFCDARSKVLLNLKSVCTRCILSRKCSCILQKKK